MKRFIILGPARSGTTALRTALSRHPQVTCHGEILAPNRVIGLFTEGVDLLSNPEKAINARKRDTIGFIELALSSDRPATGFKILYNQIVQIHAAEALTYLRSDKNLTVIFLWRRNLAKRFLSEQILHIQYANRASNRRELEVSLSVEEMFQDCRNQLHMREAVNALFAGHRAAELVYEDIVEGRQIPELNKLLDLSMPYVVLSDRKEDYKSEIQVTVTNESAILNSYESNRDKLEPL